MPAKLENSAVVTCWKRSLFIPVPKKGNARECSNYHTIALISHASKVMLKILQNTLQQYVNYELPDVQAWCRKGRGTRYQIANSFCIMEKARVPGKHLLLFIDNTKAFDCVDYTNLYAGQKPTVRTGHGTTVWFQIGKGVHQGCILSLCLFNL